MKKIVLLGIFVLLTLDAGAQRIQHQRTLLDHSEVYNKARVEVVEEPDAALAVVAADRTAKREKITGYRVSLFRDNSQTAGENARSVEAQFRGAFPGISVQVEYASPYFKVTAGNFIDKIDAIALCGKSLPDFPKAVVTQEQISISDIVSQQKSAAIKSDEENKEVEN